MMEKKGKSNPFQDYEWMGEMDNFDRQVEEELLEEDFIRTCIEQLLEEEEERETLTANEIIAQQQMQNLQINGHDQQVKQRPVFNGYNSQNSLGYTNGYGPHQKNYDNIMLKSKLNPNAKVFVPRSSS